MKTANSLTQKVLIGGDLCPIGRSMPLFEAGKAQAFFNDLLPEFEKADFSVVNLECPLIRKKTPIVKIGPTLDASETCINGIKAAGINLVGLANNHIMDHGKAGLENTINLCEKYGIDHIGAGENLAAARKIYIRQINGIYIGILSYAEQEFSIASKTTSGANPLDLIDFVQNVEEHRDQLDYLIILLHGGNENYPYPSPEMMRRCRFMVDMGADAVICSHSHCPVPWEIYQGKPIVYGQGNLIFEPLYKMPDIWYYGYLVKLTLESDKVSLGIIPYFQSKSFSGARKMDSESEREFLSNIDKKNEEIQVPGLVEKKWREYCYSKRYSYLAKLFGYNRIMTKLNKKGLLTKMLHSKESVLRALNCVRCESHREILLTIFKDVS